LLAKKIVKAHQDKQADIHQNEQLLQSGLIIKDMYRLKIVKTIKVGKEKLGNKYTILASNWIESI
jgi:hypothetical protein